MTTEDKMIMLIVLFILGACALSIPLEWFGRIPELLARVIAIYCAPSAWDCGR